MNLLLDTHLLIWAVAQSHRLPKTASALILDHVNTVYFSAATIWEIAIKSSKADADFDLDADAFRLALLNRGYYELAVTGIHATYVRHLPFIHRDPFDRILVAQAMSEGLTLLTVDRKVAQYPGSIRKV